MQTLFFMVSIELFGFYSNKGLNSVLFRSGFFNRAKLKAVRRCSAQLNEEKQSRIGKYALKAPEYRSVSVLFDKNAEKRSASYGALQSRYVVLVNRQIKPMDILRIVIASVVVTLPSPLTSPRAICSEVRVIRCIE